jgi:outer membrane protein TolC
MLPSRRSNRSISSIRVTKGGVDTYLQVITWQTALLQNQRNDIEITQRRFEASVLLIKALGGGWNASQLPQRP